MSDPAERLIRLEEKHDNMYKLTQQIADNADSTAKALHELVLIHKETSVKAEADRKAMRQTQVSLQQLWTRYNTLNKTVWRCIWTGAGMGLVLSVIWYAGLMPALIEAKTTMAVLWNGFTGTTS